MFGDPIELYRVVRESWSKDTVDEFDPSRSARNQCAVTSLAVHHYFGGEILKTPTVGGLHFYNRIDETIWDLTVEQFDEPIPFHNIQSSEAEAFQHVTPDQLRALIVGIESLANASRESR